MSLGLGLGLEAQNLVLGLVLSHWVSVLVLNLGVSVSVLQPKVSFLVLKPKASFFVWVLSLSLKPLSLDLGVGLEPMPGCHKPSKRKVDL